MPKRIGIFAYRSETAYTGTLAALFSGAAFVPLNPTFPADKNRSIAEQAGLSAIIVDRTCAAQAGKVLEGLRDLVLLTPDLDSPDFGSLNGRVIDRGELAQTKPLEKLPPVCPDDIAYLLFTSGSTGKPKGVPVSHGNVVSFIDTMSSRYQIGPDDRLSQTFDQTFDLSVFDLFMAWANGASVHSLSTIDLLAPTKFIQEHELTLWFSVPSLPAHMIRRKTLIADSLPKLRWSLFCGEPLPRRTAELWQEAAPNSIVENQYGPTELTIACFVHRWEPASSPQLCYNGTVPIGRPYPGMSALLLDDHLNETAWGEAGELCVAGPQTVPGYWQDESRTAERFVQIPISAGEKRRFYRTGDQVKRLSSGDYVFLGRSDSQIKVLGHRVELGEVEAALCSSESIEHAVAFGWPAEQVSADGVIAFVTGPAVDTEAVLLRATSVLPPYAVPHKLIAVDQMPLNPNGKVDRPALLRQLKSSESV